MKKTIFVVIISLFMFNNEAKSQVAASLYNVNRDDFNQHNKEGRLLRGVLITGILVGGLLIAEEANNHDYYYRHTLIYGVGGIMTILATGLVISSVNYLNKQIDFGSINCLKKEINFAYTENGLTAKIRI